MFYPLNIAVLDPQIRASLSAELADAVHDPLLQPLLHDNDTALLPRYIRCYEQLSRQPRKLRRQLQRQWQRSLAGVALLMALGQGPGLAAAINVTTANPNIVPGSGCSLIEAIENANDTATGSVHSDCASGAPAGADTIRLPANSVHILTAINNPADSGNNGLPVITSSITIDGRHSTIKRQSTAPIFRIFDIVDHLTLNDTTVSGGRSEASGGGAYIEFDGGLTINNSTFSGNSAAFNGGGIKSREDTSLILTNSTVSGNSAGRLGGGISVGEYGTLLLNNSTVSGNRAFSGGGLVALSSNPIHIINSTISGNSATNDGGGIYNNFDAGPNSLINSTVSGNKAGKRGGGIFNYSVFTLSLTNSTVTDNSAGLQGGGVFNGNYYDYIGRVDIARTLISGNLSPSGPEIFNNAASSIIINNFNLFGHNSTSGVVGFTPGASDLVPAQSVAQILSTTLASNGGLTQTHALPFSSPAIDASPDDADCQAKDQRGIVRPQDGDADGVTACDIGSFELESLPRFVYGVQDTGVAKSQFFKLNKTGFTVSNVGPLQSGRAIEGLDIHPSTHVLYGASSAANTLGQKGFLFSVSKTTGALTPIGPTGFNSISALSFRPTDGSLWGWAEGKGLVKIKLTTGAANLVLASTQGVNGVAWNNTGTSLYAAAGRNLFRYSPATNQLSQIAANLPSPAEALEMRPDGLLAVGAEGATAIEAYDPIAKQPVPAKNVFTGFNDVKGIAWPADAL